MHVFFNGTEGLFRALTLLLSTRMGFDRFEKWMLHHGSWDYLCWSVTGVTSIKVTRGSWRNSQLALDERHGAPWAGHQCITFTPIGTSGGNPWRHGKNMQTQHPFSCEVQTQNSANHCTTVQLTGVTFVGKNHDDRTHLLCLLFRNLLYVITSCIWHFIKMVKNFLQNNSSTPWHTEDEDDELNRPQSVYFLSKCM